MTETQFLAVAFACLAVINWSVAVTLMRIARNQPRIRALTERALLATLIAVLTTAYTFVVFNSESHAIMGFETSRDIVRLTVFVLGIYPAWWLWSYYAGRF